MPFDFSPYAAVLLDLDGTLYHEDHMLPGARELVARIHGEGRRYACLTNSTSSAARVASRLARMGIPMSEEHIYTAAQASADYVLEHFGHRPRIFNLATEGVQEMLDGKVEWVTSKDQPCDAVIVGVPVNAYATDQRQRTALYLLKAGAKLIGTCADRVFPSPRGLEFGAGALSSLLAYAANVTPIYTGKPERIFFEELCTRLGVAPRDCILVGDNLESDIAGARRVGMKTILTLTGVSARRDIERVPAEYRPDWVITDLTELA